MIVGPGDAEPSQSPGGEVAASLVPAQQVTFDRRELNRLLGLYGRKVAARTVRGLNRTIRSFVPQLGAQECTNYFRHAGYASI